MNNVRAAFTDELNFFAIAGDNTLYGSGRNFYAALGTGDEKERTGFVEIMRDVKNISSNSDGTTFIIKTDNTLWGFGRNFNGQLLGFQEELSLEPVYITDNVQSVHQNRLSSQYLIKTDDSLWT